MKKILIKILSLILIFSSAVCAVLFGTQKLAFASEQAQTGFFLPSSPLEFYELNSPVSISYSDDGYMIISEFFKDEENASKNFNRISIYDPTIEKYVVIEGKGLLNGESTIFGITQIEKYGDYVFYLSGNDIYYIPTSNLYAKPQKTGVIASNFFSIKNDILIANTSNGIKTYTVDLSGSTPTFNQTAIEIEVEMTSLGFLSNDKQVYYYADPYLYRYSTQNSTSYLVAEIKNINYCVELGDYIYYTAMGEGLSKIKKDGTEEPILVIPADKSSTSLGSFNTPQGLTVKENKLLVCDIALNCIQEIDTATDSFTHFAITTESTADFRLTNNASNIALSENYVYAVDNASVVIDNETPKKRIVKVSLDKELNYPCVKIDLSSIYQENPEFEIKNIACSDTHVLIYDGKNLTLYKQIIDSVITLEPVKTIQNSSVTSICYLDDVFYITDTANNLNYNYVNVYKWVMPTNDNELTKIKEESLLDDTTEIKGEAKNITVDIFGNVYIHYLSDNSNRYLVRINNGTLSSPALINHSVLSMQTDFDGNVYMLSNNNNVYRYTLKDNSHDKTDYKLSTYKDTTVKDLCLTYSSETAYMLSSACIYNTVDNSLNIKSLSKINADNLNPTSILTDATFITINPNAKLFKVDLSNTIVEDGVSYFSDITPISLPNTSKVYAVIADLSGDYYLISYSQKLVALVRKSSVSATSPKADATIIDESLYSQYGIEVVDENDKELIISNATTTFAKPIFDANYQLATLSKGDVVYAIKTITFNGKTMTLVSLEKGGNAIGYVVNGYLLTEIITTPTYNDESQILIGGNAEKRIVTTLMILLIALTITISLLFIESKLLFKKE